MNWLHCKFPGVDGIASRSIVGTSCALLAIFLFSNSSNAGIGPAVYCGATFSEVGSDVSGRVKDSSMPDFTTHELSIGENRFVIYEGTGLGGRRRCRSLEGRARQILA